MTIFRHKDPAIPALERYLAYLAGSWRKTKHEELVEEYHRAYHRLRELGYTGLIDIDASLPAHLMPEDKKELSGD